MKSTAKTLFFSVIFFLGAFSGVVAQDLYSYGDAPASYGGGVAKHKVSPGLFIGTIGHPELQTPIHSIMANTNGNDDGIVIPESGGFTNWAASPFQLSGTNLQVTVKITKAAGTPNLIGWIDFNQDGSFQKEEASAVVAVTGGTATLSWVGVTSKMRQGVTYMRLKLTSAVIADVDAAKPFNDGEIEDYRLNLNVLTFTKEANEPNRKRLLGDTIEYTLKINPSFNLSSVAVLDPLPSYTKYLNDGTATSGISTGKENINGQLVDVVKWVNQAITTAGKVYKFKVVVSEMPKATEIYNVGLVLYNNDTVYSTGTDCNLTPVPVSQILAKNDSVTIVKGCNNVVFEPFRNDSLGACPNKANGLIAGIVSGPNASFGTAVDNGNNTFTFTPKTTAKGVDSMTYYIKCKEDSVTAKVFYLINQPDTTQECATSLAVIGYEAQTDITYYWFTDKTGNTAPAGVTNPKNTITINKADDKEYWVEPRWKGHKFPRIYVKLDWNS